MRGSTCSAAQAHVRRYFEKALDYDRENAAWVLGKIGELYAIDGIEPFTWLRDTLTKTQDHPVNRIEELLPIKKPQYQK